MSEKFYDYSTYCYGQDKPTGNIDIKGKFVFKDVTNHPQLAKLIQSISGVLDNTNILSNLSRFSGMDPGVIRQQFQDNRGPIIQIADLQLLYYTPVAQTIGGTKEKPTYEGTIQLDNAMVKHLEDAFNEGNIEEYNDYLIYDYSGQCVQRLWSIVYNPKRD
jgi:hypothetical protein